MRKSRKYLGAIAVANREGVDFKEGDYQGLYQRLEEKRWFWNRSLGHWQKTDCADDPPTPLLRVRLWGDKNLVPFDKEKLVEALAEAGYQLVEQSEVYPCRPPKTLEGRIYLSFERR